MAPQSAQTPSNTTAVELFDYPPIGDSPILSWEAFGFDVITDCGAAAHDTHHLAVITAADNKPPNRNEVEKAPSEELNRSFEIGRMRGLEEGRAAEREAAVAMAKVRETHWDEQFASLVESFDTGKKQYFESVEREVVQLALTVAAQILRRESQVDPLLLSGAVRVALGQLSSTTQVRLRVPCADLELWTQTIAHLPGLNVKPAVTGDENLNLGECVLESDLGSVDLSIASQLAEIERGFLDQGSADHPLAKPIAVEEDMSE